MKPTIVVIIVLAVLAGLVWLGVSIKPAPFPHFGGMSVDRGAVPLPTGLPIPVERFYRTVYGDEVPVIETVVFSGRASMSPVPGLSLPARFVFVHNAGHDYRHYFEATLFGLPLLKVNEGYIEGESYFESPMGSYRDDPNTNQAANLSLWAEAAMFPAILVTDPRVRWAPVDDQTALLYVPFEEGEDTFVVRFNPQSGLIDAMEAMRYREPGEDKPKILWITRYEPGPTLPGSKMGATGSTTWLDQGRPWAVFTAEQAVFNADVSRYIRQRGH